MSNSPSSMAHLISRPDVSGFCRTCRRGWLVITSMVGLKLVCGEDESVGQLFKLGVPLLRVLQCMAHVEDGELDAVRSTDEHGAQGRC
ncbi:unnamed protein product [Prunus armeniaca]